MKINLYIPDDIKVGQQERHDTFSKRLGFVIFRDNKNVLRQENTWNSWRDKNIEPLDFKNEPMSGFILNKGVERYGYYGSGRSVVRIFDPRGFEFEISVDNLMFILMHSDVSKQDILEKCVYAWSGKNLVLLPVNSKEYEESVKFTEDQFKKISSKELVLGHSYALKKDVNSSLVYLGIHDWYDYKSYYNGNRDIEPLYNKKREHVFYNTELKSYEKIKINTLSKVVSERDDHDCANLIDLYYKESVHSSKLKELIIDKYSLESMKNQIRYGYLKYYFIENNIIKEYELRFNQLSYDNKKIENMILRQFISTEYEFKDNKISVLNTKDIVSQSSYYNPRNDDVSLNKQENKEEFSFLSVFVKEYEEPLDYYNNKSVRKVKRLCVKELIDYFNSKYGNEVYLLLENNVKTKISLV